ncbi:MAG TPA: alkaline phosphatase family protein [Polyangiaceae bacterium]|nr:alkaline phosphatase family protein [Polyangiaceae bacterium]
MTLATGVFASISFLFLTTRKTFALFVSVAVAAGCSAASSPQSTRANVGAASSHVEATRSNAGSPQRDARSGRHVIVFVWDGLRPDSVTPALTPHLARLRDHDGVNFREQHAVYPTVTMMNAASLATGAYPATHGFFGNTVYWPGPRGTGADGNTLDFTRPVFTEDYGVLMALDVDARKTQSALLRVETLAEVAHAAGLMTAVIGKSGPAFLQDYREDGAHGVVLDENVALPLAFAKALQAHGFPLPKATTKFAYADGSLMLATDNGDPTASTPSALVMLADGTTPEPRADRGSPHSAKNDYLMRVFREYVLPAYDPALSIVWLRNPDTTEHTYGPGAPAVLSALCDQDALLGGLLDALAASGKAANTDVLVMSDHGHSTVAGDATLFPLRRLDGPADGSGKVDGADAAGFSVSGAVRTADLLTRAGLAHVYDGVGCVYAPGLAGTTANGKPLYASRVDRDGKLCGKAGECYLTPSYRAPSPLPGDAIIVAPNGGSEYFYVAGHDPRRVRELVQRLQERALYGAIFVGERFGALPGTMSLARVRIENPERDGPPTPDVIASYDFDDGAKTGSVMAAPGTEYASALNYRGMHGAPSPTDVHGTLIASGPDFKQGFADGEPSGNVDVAPTVAKLLGLSLPHADGRILDEALAGSDVHHVVTPLVEQATPAKVARFCRADDPDCRRPLPAGVYRFELRETALTAADGKRYLYLDAAKATRSTK